MYSLLLTFLAVTGAFCHPSLVTEDVGEEDCPKCLDTHPILTVADLNKICKNLPIRKSCYNNLQPQCKTTDYKNRLDALDYMCQASVKARVGTQISTCIQPNQAIIDEKYKRCNTAIPGTASGSCKMSAIRKCVLKSLLDCCKAACSDHDKYVYYFIKPSTITSGCPWNYDSGYCNLPASPCVMPSK